MPVVLVGLAIGLFMMYTNSTYEGVGPLKASLNSYQEALAQSQEVLNLRNKLLDERNNLPQDSMQRLDRLLPGSIDPIRTIISVNDVAVRHNMQVGRITLEGEDGSANSTTGGETAGVSLGSDGISLGVMTLSFSVKAGYADFRGFLFDLERSLRLMDVIKIAFTASGEQSDEYTVTVKTYWIK